jgi:hypothetical protein
MLGVNPECAATALPGFIVLLEITSQLFATVKQRVLYFIEIKNNLT